MKDIRKKLKTCILLLFLALAVSGASAKLTETQVQAATKTGFQTIGGKTYYIQANGTKKKGWLKLSNGKAYYFNPSTGVLHKGWLVYNQKNFYLYNKAKPEDCYMASGWLKDSKGNTRYFHPNAGFMATGWLTYKNNKYYLDPKTGFLLKGWILIGKDRYCLNSKTGVMWANVVLRDNTRGIRRYVGADGKMVRGWLKVRAGKWQYYKTGSKLAEDGIMATGFFKINQYFFYFDPTTGFKGTGWLYNNKTGARYYLDPAKNGAVVFNQERTIDGVTYIFDTKGVARVKNTDPTTAPTGTKTIKNYLLGALQPVGQALYVWGGGWTDATRKGVSPTWKQWYDSQSSSYNYNYYRDLSASTRAKGLDCSGFVGWAAYQVMQSKSGVGSGYTVVSGEVGSSYRARGWGYIVTQASLASAGYKLCAGDVGYNDGHTWIVVGQCADKSVVIVHSTPNAGCQIAGTPTPSGNYSSQAIVLAKKYMSKYAGYTKYAYHTSSGNYVKNGNYLRWNRATLLDPDGYMNKTADQILADLFSGR